jgi:hypothetical protein
MQVSEKIVTTTPMTALWREDGTSVLEELAASPMWRSQLFSIPAKCDSLLLMWASLYGRFHRERALISGIQRRSKTSTTQRNQSSLTHSLARIASVRHA